MLRLTSCEDGTYKRGVFINVFGHVLASITFWHTVARDYPPTPQVDKGEESTHVIGFRGCGE